jgi:hypothetical protein
VENFEQFLRTGQIPLPPSFYNRFIEENPSVHKFVFAAGSDDSRLARDMEVLIASYFHVGGIFVMILLDFCVLKIVFCILFTISGASCTCAGGNVELCGRNMTAFNFCLWVMLQRHAPARFRYNVAFERIYKSDTTTTGVR